MALTLARRSSLVPIFQMLSGSATMSATRRRGLSDEIGSWKIICTCVRSRRRSLRFSAVTSVPSKVILPDVGLSTWTMARPVVDFPQPDSPTRPRVSPSFRVKLMPATACTVLWPLVNETKRSSTASSGPPARASAPAPGDDGRSRGSRRSGAPRSARRARHLAHAGSPPPPPAPAATADSCVGRGNQQA